MTKRRLGESRKDHWRRRKDSGWFWTNMQLRWNYNKIVRAREKKEKAEKHKRSIAEARRLKALRKLEKKKVDSIELARKIAIARQKTMEKIRKENGEEAAQIYDELTKQLIKKPVFNQGNIKDDYTDWY